MFISLSKVFAKIGGVRFGLGLRLTKSNFIWMSFLLCFVYMLQATAYMMVITFWLVYAMFYGYFWCTKKLILCIIKLFKKLTGRG